jgi:hypothetical protein
MRSSCACAAKMSFSVSSLRFTSRRRTHLRWGFIYDAMRSEREESDLFITQHGKIGNWTARAKSFRRARLVELAWLWWLVPSLAHARAQPFGPSLQSFRLPREELCLSWRLA